MTLHVIENEFSEVNGFFKIRLSNRDRLLFTRKEYGSLKYNEELEHLMFESSSGQFYKPSINKNEICFYKV